MVNNRLTGGRQNRAFSRSEKGLSRRLSRGVRSNHHFGNLDGLGVSYLSRERRIPAPELLAMIPEVQQLFVDAPEDETRSRLEPYREQILLWRRHGKTYRRIRQLLADRCSVSVSLAMVHKFVGNRSRPRKVQLEVQVTPVVETAAPLEQASTPQLSLEERIAQLNAIRAAHNKPSVKREETERVFEFDEANYIPVNKNYNT